MAATICGNRQPKPPSLDEFWVCGLPPNHTKPVLTETEDLPQGTPHEDPDSEDSLTHETIKWW